MRRGGVNIIFLFFFLQKGNRREQVSGDCAPESFKDVGLRTTSLLLSPSYGIRYYSNQKKRWIGMRKGGEGSWKKKSCSSFMCRIVHKKCKRPTSFSNLLILFSFLFYCKSFFFLLSVYTILLPKMSI